MLSKILRHTCATGVFIVITLCSRETAGQVARVSVDELAVASTTVVHGRTGSIRSYWSADKRYILTDITLQVDAAFKGASEAETVLTIPGGRVGSTLYEVSDMPVFIEGEEVVVFVWENASGKKTVTGGFKGKLSVIDDPAADRKVVLGTFDFQDADTNVGSKTGGVLPLDAPEKPSRMYLDDFRTRIKEIGNR